MKIGTVTVLLTVCSALAIISAAEPAASGVLPQDVKPPTLVKHVPPGYPEAARQRGIEGAVVVEATVGPDGKVSNAVVVRSVPELDSAAIDAVRQWGYAPTIVGGVAVPVLMTVTVTFDLEQPPAETPAVPRLILKHDGRGWSLNGRPVADGEIETSLRSVLETRRRKDLYVHVPPTFSYPRLIDALAAGVNAGVEQSFLIEGNGAVETAVAVRLDAVPGLENDLRLPVADVSYASVATPVVVRIAAGVEPEKTASLPLLDAIAGASVRLHVDSTRTAVDVWSVLRLGRSRGVELFSLAVERPESPGRMATGCREGRAEACGRLGWWYFSGSEGLAQDYSAAMTWLRLGCAGDDATSCALMAEMHEHGMGARKDPKEAVRLYTESCRLGFADSCEWLRRGGHPVPARKPPSRR
jgi:TonB family protein